MEALWPEQPPNRQRLATIVSRARATLGKTPQGDDYLPTKPRGDLYQVSTQLGCDLERFTHRVQAAAKASPAAAQQRRRAALELVDGRPFNGIGNAYGWAHTEGIITHVIVAVDNVAHRLAQLALDANDTALAMWAARQGLTATGVCEECYRNLMRCAIAEDNQTALDATLEELTVVMDADDGPDAVTYLEQDTIELYEQHRRNRRSHAE